MTGRIDFVADGIAFGESPRWHQGRVWFCDWVDGDVLSVAPDGSDRTTHAHLDGFPICIDWDAAGHLLLVDGAGKRLVRSVGASFEMLADLSALSDAPWNEIVVHPSGSVYVNGIGFDMLAGQPATTGQVARVDPDGTLSVVATGLRFPNGMALSPGGDTLVVAESHAGRIARFEVQPDGQLSARGAFAEIPGSAPDGLCFAPDGTLWYADVPNRHCRHLDQHGAVLHTIEVDRGCFSCALSPAGSLFITATVWDDDTFSTRRGVLYRVQL